MDSKLKMKIGQMFMCGFAGTKIDGDMYYNIDKYFLGNIILFSRNIENKKQVTELIENLKSIIIRRTDTLPFIGTDQEGGTVSRFSNVFGEQLGQYALGALDDEELTFKYGADIGYRLKELGVNLNFAPVVDINSNPENTSIGIRTFSRDKEKVKRLALNMYKGYESSYIMPAIKHFPGLGDVDVDLHYELPIIDKPLEEIRNNELLPFKDAVNNGLKALIVSHVMLLDVDDEYPASMSKKIIKKLLREELGYKNLVISDCIEMGAIKNNYGIGEAVIIGISAGVDMFIISSDIETQAKAIESVYNAIEEGIISEARINESYERIVHAKYQTMRRTNKPKEIDFEEIYLNVLKTNNFKKLNLNKENTIAIAVNQFINTKSEDMSKNPINICDIFEKHTDIKTYGFDKDLNDKELDILVEKSKNYTDILLFVANMDMFKQQHKLYNRLSNKNIYLFDMKIKVNKLSKEPKTYFCAYAYRNVTVKIMCKYLKDFM